MTAPEEKKTPVVVPTRAPKKKTPGTFDNLRQPSQLHPVEELLGLDFATPSTPSTPTRASSSSTDSIPSRAANDAPGAAEMGSPISPQRNYAKVANSIVRAAVPAGVFGEQGGKGKELYDFLYLLTRGAVVPRRQVRITKDKLMRGAGIGSEVTLRKNLVRLRVVKLVKETIVPGMHGGNEYEIFLPEEVGLNIQTGATPSRGSSPASSPQYRESVETVESRASSPSLNEVVPDTYDDDKTLLLRPLGKADDDEAFAALLSQLKEVSSEITGKAPSASDAARWGELGELLAGELRAAAERTSVVSSVPALLTEHLRRRLNKPAPTKPTPVTAPHPTQPPVPPTDEELVSTFVDFLHGGMTLADLDNNLSKSVEPERWPGIRKQVVERYDSERAHMAAPGEAPSRAGN